MRVPRTESERRIHSDGQRGSSVTEMALVAPLFVILLLWGAYVADLGRARIKQQEATRFFTWELASHALSDPGNAHHAERFRAARERVVADTFRRYRTLEGHGPEARSQGLVTRASLGDLDVQAVGLDVAGEVETPSGAVGAFDEVVRMSGRAQRPVLERFGLNLDRIGGRTELKAVLENRLLPKRFLDGSYFSSRFFPNRCDRLELAPMRMRLEPDTWAIASGEDVNLGDRSSAFYRQVDRIALLGLGSELSRKAGPAGAVLDWFPIKLQAQVVSRGYGEGLADRSMVSGCSDDSLARSGKWKNGRGTAADGMSKVKCFDTLPIDADKIGRGYRGDPSYRILESRANAYMGSREPGAYAGGAR